MHNLPKPIFQSQSFFKNAPPQFAIRSIFRVILLVPEFTTTPHTNKQLAPLNQSLFLKFSSVQQSFFSSA